MHYKTIILLCAPRSGSTAVMKIFQKHPDVGLSHFDQSIDNCEPHFWTLANRAIKGDSNALCAEFKETMPDIFLPDIFNDKTVFELWDMVLEKYGPVIFDKSPFYLGDKKAIDLLFRYKNSGHDVRFIALVRDPRDCIISQFEMWDSMTKYVTPDNKELGWQAQYEHLIEIQKLEYIPLFRYEDICAAPNCYMPQVMRHFGVCNLPYTYAHIRPAKQERERYSLWRRVRLWKVKYKTKQLMMRFGYSSKRSDIISIANIIYRFPRDIYRAIRNIIRLQKMRKY